MSPLASSAKALAKFLGRRHSSLLPGRSPGQWTGRPNRFLHTRWFNAAAQIGSPFSHAFGDDVKCKRPIIGSFPCSAQSRWFLGVPDGDEGGVLCRSHEERVVLGAQSRGFLGVGDGEKRDGLCRSHEERVVLGYTQEQLFDVAATVDMYEEFIPWCQRSRIVRRNEDGSFDAELEIGFKFLVEKYMSHVELQKPKLIKTTALDTGLFEHLINIWEFNPGPVPGSCNLHFLVNFKFQSPLYRQVASVFFQEVVSRIVNSFSDRCRRIYGPGTRILENSYGECRSSDQLRR